MVLGRKHDEWDGRERRAPASVLVVDDDRDACELLVRILAAAGFRAAGAHSDMEAMARMVDDLPRCVVLDMTTGGIGSSLTILEQVRNHDDHKVSSARVVLCAPSARNRSFSFQSGADSFLIRPFHADDLVAAVNDVIARPEAERARHRRDELARQS